MSEPGPIEARPLGRPSLGGVMKEAFKADAWRRERQRDLRPLGKLTPFVLAHGLDAFLSGFFILVSAGALLFLTWRLKAVVDHGVALRNQAELVNAFAGLTAVAFILAASTGLRIFFTLKLGERVVADLRKQVFKHVLTLDQSHFMRLRTGEMLSRLTTDMTMVERAVGNVVPVALRNLITFLGALVSMVVISPRFTGLVLVLIPLLLTPLAILGRRMQRLSILAQDRFAQAIGIAGEGLEAIETVQAFGQEESMSERFDSSVEKAFAASRAQLRARGTMSGLMITLIAGGLLILLFQCAMAVFIQRDAHGHPLMSSGSLTALLALAMVAASAVRDLSEVWGEIQKASGAASRAMDILALTPAIAAPAHPKPLPVPARGAVSFHNVRFAYPGRAEAALNGFTLDVRPGERVALVGPSGAGKSTVLRLLLRFYDPTSGEVSIDGVDLRDADPREVRARMALVAQDTPLFSGSAAENIAFGRAGADAQAVRDAALAAQAEGFLSALPQGFDTAVGERAKTLSGGQRQRLAIARALVRRSPILLLDEATSALDAENERLVQKALLEAMEGRTTLVIAHRLATVLEADRIVVMEDGRVVEEGRHAELMARGGLYAHLAKLQFGEEAA
ncbi:ABC transporter transmembrane domain-containing protein [Caulobacter sp. KR2-114]|uniref:ABC transporter transmembrane domain-containing protein n=1 Tax=Caulobacter sp. KR2-114 TaxID=3400912 RepID=UPI003C05E314